MAPCRVPLILPMAGNSRLEVQEEGLALLKSISGPVAPVVVIGPYRSGDHESAAFVEEMLISFLMCLHLVGPREVLHSEPAAGGEMRRRVWCWPHERYADEGDLVMECSQGRNCDQPRGGRGTHVSLILRH